MISGCNYWLGLNGLFEIIIVFSIVTGFSNKGLKYIPLQKKYEHNLIMNGFPYNQTTGCLETLATSASPFLSGYILSKTL